MPRKVIYLSRELEKSIKNYRGKLNLSKIFARGVMEQISGKKMIDSDTDLEDIIERLKEEKQEFKPDYFKMGRAEGFDLARSLSYAAIQHALQLKIEADSNPVEDKFLGKHFQEVMGREKFDETAPMHDFTEYAAGFLNGIKDFWQLVKDKI
jgi:hypothetical protein